MGVECLNGFDFDLGYEVEEYDASGQFCATKLQVENVGDSPGSFHAYWDASVMDSQERTHNTAVDQEGSYNQAFIPEGDGAYFNELNPGQSGEAYHLFDIPRDVVPRELILTVWSDDASGDLTTYRIDLPEPEWVGAGTVEWQD